MGTNQTLSVIPNKCSKEPTLCTGISDQTVLLPLKACTDRSAEITLGISAACGFEYPTAALRHVRNTDCVTGFSIKDAGGTGNHAFTRLIMLICHKVTHKNLLDSRPLFRSMIQILRVILHFTICFRRIARFFSKAFSEMAHLAKINADRNNANRFSCSFQKLCCH